MDALVATWTGVTITLAMMVVAFLVLRNVALWYWRVPEVLTVLHEISASLARIEAASRTDAPLPSGSHHGGAIGGEHTHCAGR